jgi:hypothetical protein
VVAVVGLVGQGVVAVVDLAAVVGVGAGQGALVGSGVGLVEGLASEESDRGQRASAGVVEQVSGGGLYDRGRGGQSHRAGGRPT